MEKQILTTKNVKLSYGDFEALHGIDLAFNEHEITALIGPSGCGKSTYLRCLNRMNDQIDGVNISGEFKLHDTDIYGENTDVVELRKHIGMVFQQPNPFPMSIYDNVVFGLRVAGVRDKAKLDEAVQTALKQAAIWDEVKDKLDQNALALSGGQQQRICIARALAVSPDVLLLDEPTSALDPHSSRQIEATLLQLKEQYTIITVTHNLQQAARIADRTAFFLQGDLIEAASTKQIFMNPEHEQTRDFITGRFG
ncbi:phosphate ABC transporter ATP-binding protein PstB [Paucilactobacillus kaifaensis]|uniref:phosphate ABC transporter ATP-binding protein PstB n=1 Tax=Paucilactobacillus kaifaensis TaxID=2559921 RepID=UPI0010F70F66|nr:phosphate ABC transporter ATP-binding protein PstB [Paucilactobacillus kaifaensis]